jgi:hypothetical protein
MIDVVFCFDARVFSLSLSLSLSLFKIFFSSLPSILNLKNAYLLLIKNECLFVIGKLESGLKAGKWFESWKED